MARRRVVDPIRPVEPEPDSDCDVAFAFDFDDGSHMTVEFAAPSSASESEARQAVTPYLDDPDPPRRLIVNRSGRVSVAE